MKFLDAQEKLKRVLEENNGQKSFSFVDTPYNPSITKAMAKAVAYDNVEIYKIGVMNGLLPKEVAKQLKKLEQDGKLVVSEIKGKKRNKGGFYIGYKQYRNIEKIITLRLTTYGSPKFGGKSEIS